MLSTPDALSTLTDRGLANWWQLRDYLALSRSADLHGEESLGRRPSPAVSNIKPSSRCTMSRFDRDGFCGLWRWFPANDCAGVEL